MRRRRTSSATLCALSTWARDQSGPRSAGAASNYTLTLVEGRERPQQGDQWVGAGVEKIVVPECADGGVLRASGSEGHCPSLLTLPYSKGVLVVGYQPDSRLGVVGGDLPANYPVVQAAGHDHSAVHVSHQLQGEWLRDGDGLQEVLHAEERPLPGPGWSYRQQYRPWPHLFGPKQTFLRLIHPIAPFQSLAPPRSPLDDLRLLRSGLDADWEPLSPGQQKPVTPGTGQEPPLQVVGQVKGLAHGAYGRGVLLEQQLEGGVLEESPAGVAGDGTR